MFSSAAGWVWSLWIIEESPALSPNASYSLSWAGPNLPPWGGSGRDGWQGMSRAEPLHARTQSTGALRHSSSTGKPCSSESPCRAGECNALRRTFTARCCSTRMAPGLRPRI